MRGLLGRMRAALPEHQVEVGLLEFPTVGLPSLGDAVTRCVETGVLSLAVLPLLLHQAGHSKRDVPGQLLAALAQRPEVRLSTTPSLGIQSRLLDVIIERADQAERLFRGADPTPTALLLVGRGSTDAEANAEFFEVARLLKPRTAYGWVEGCFVSLAEPYVRDGIERCLDLGAQRVIVVPYFLSTGVLVKRIGSQVIDAQTAHPQNEFAVGSHIGIHPNLIEVLVEQAQRLFANLAGTTEVILT